MARRSDLACYEGPADSRERIWRLAKRRADLASVKSVLSRIVGRRLAPLWIRLLHVPRSSNRAATERLCALEATGALARKAPSLSESASASLAVSAWALELMEWSDNVDLCASALNLAERESLRSARVFLRLSDDVNAAFALDNSSNCGPEKTTLRGSSSKATETKKDSFAFGGCKPRQGGKLPRPVCVFAQAG